METEIIRGTEAKLSGSDLDKVSKTIFIVFQPWASQPSLDRPGYGRAYFVSRGVPALYITPKQNDWYQSKDAIRVLVAAAEIAQKYERRISYGSSMGGYAALNFANDLDVQASISIMPQYSIDRTKVPFEDRWATEALRTDLFNDKIRLFEGERRYGAVLYDRLYAPDRKQVEIIENYIKRPAISLPMTGHSGPNSFVLKNIIEAASEGNFKSLPSIAAKSHRLDRKKGATYYLQLARLPRFLSPDERLKILQKASEIDSNNIKIDLERSRVLLLNGRTSEAIVEQRASLKKYPESADLNSHLAQSLSREGNIDEAMSAVSRSLSLAPENAYYHHQMADLLNRSGFLERAIEFQTDAVRLEPLNKVYNDHMQHLISKLQAARPESV